MVVSSGAQEYCISGGVLLTAFAEVVDDLRFRHLARNLEIAIQAILAGNCLEKIVNRMNADLAQHLLAFGGRFGKITHLGSLSLRAQRGIPPTPTNFG